MTKKINLNNLIKNIFINTSFDDSKTFLVFNTACFGDVLLCNSLVQNIKIAFPASKVLFICDKPWIDVAKYQEGVDEVIVYDKKGEHKGFLGILKFVANFPYHKPFISFLPYENVRNYLIAKLLGSRFVKQGNKIRGTVSVQEKHTNLLQPYTNNSVKNLPIKFNIPENIENKVNIDEKYVVLCTTSKNITKDMPIDTAIELINKINSETEYRVVFTGVGQKALDYSKELHNAGCDFIDLTNKTTLLELARVVKDSECLISVDTGTMHLGYSVGIPTVAVFYEKGTTDLWAPNENLYKIKLIDSEQTTKNIINCMNSLIEVIKD